MLDCRIIWYLKFCFLVFVLLCCFLWPYPQHMEVPRLGVQSEPIPQPQQCRIWAVSATYTTAHGNASSLTHWTRPGIEPTTSWFLIRFVSAAPQQELLKFFFFFFFFWGTFILFSTVAAPIYSPNTVGGFLFLYTKRMIILFKKEESYIFWRLDTEGSKVGHV